MKFILVIVLMPFCSITLANGSDEVRQITQVLTDYIDGTANGDIERIKRAFHPDLNLYSISKDGGLRVQSGKDYIGYFEPGKKVNRIGRIVMLDYENDAATAKVEVVMPSRGVYVDYFLLLKYADTWKIIHKSYTLKEAFAKES